MIYARSPPPLSSRPLEVNAQHTGNPLLIMSSPGRFDYIYLLFQIHERGKRYEVEWASHNNRGEEVDTAVERRIGLPVTYSLAGAAAEAVREAEPGTQAAILARKGVLAEARIGSWCIKHPEEAWGMLDPFGEDSTMI